MKIILKDGREALTEGRSYGLGFAFAELVEEDCLECVMPISACKDYLNDVVFTESTGITSKRVHGFLYGKKKNIFLEDGSGYLVMSVLDFKSQDWVNKKYYLETFKSNLNNIERLIRDFTIKLNLSLDIKIEISEDNLFYCKVPNFFLTNTYGISLLSLLIRTGCFYTHDNIDSFFGAKTLDSIYYDDNFLINELNRIRHKINSDTFLDKSQMIKSFGKKKNMEAVHDGGIISLKYKL